MDATVVVALGLPFLMDVPRRVATARASNEATSWSSYIGTTAGRIVVRTATESLAGARPLTSPGVRPLRLGVVNSGC